MLDEKLLRRDVDAVAKEMQRRGADLDALHFSALEADRKQLDVQLQDLQAERNASSKRIGQLIKEGVPVDEAKQQQAQALANTDLQLGAVKEQQIANRSELDALLLGLPNIADSDVPEGNDESANVELSKWGAPTAFEFEPKDHVALGERKHLMDFETAAKLTGSRFVVMRQEIAQLHRALIQFMLDTHIEQNGYQEIYVPFMVNSDSMTGTGQLPKFAEDSFAIHMDGDKPYYLIPTAEVPVTNIARNEILSEKDNPAFGAVPLKFVCHSPCFRSEAGSYGRDTRGMIRQHQFEKVELVQLVPPEQSSDAHEALTGHAESILRLLDLPYRKVILCTGDLGASARRTYDLEVWLPGQNAYREISSCSNFGDYQARRMGARWRNPKTGKPELLHTLNGSGLAIGRTLVAVLENGQNEDGSVRIPSCLQPYMRGKGTILSA